MLSVFEFSLETKHQILAFLSISFKLSLLLLHDLELCSKFINHLVLAHDISLVALLNDIMHPLKMLDGMICVLGLRFLTLNLNFKSTNLRLSFSEVRGNLLRSGRLIGKLLLKKRLSVA